jgi:hypothetical protein
MATPPPQPVPRITPKTTRAPAAAPSIASETAKQLASLATRTSRPRAAERSRSKGSPLTQTALEFLAKPVKGEMVPGKPTPTLPRSPDSRSSSWTSPAMARTVAW